MIYFFKVRTDMTISQCLWERFHLCRLLQSAVSAWTFLRYVDSDDPLLITDPL